MNQLYRARLQELVEGAMARFSSSDGLGHFGLKGRAREVAVSKIIQPMLTENFSLGSGLITDYSGSQSQEMDCVLYSKLLVPSLMFSGTSGVFPLDAVFAAVEIKSRLTAGELDKTLAGTSSVWKLQYSTGTFKRFADGTVTQLVQALIPALFAFGSDLREGGKTELDRYREKDPHSDEKPQLTMICVVGKGFWCFNREAKKWLFHRPTDGFDEVIDFVAMLIEFSTYLASARPPARTSSYLVDHEGYDKDGNVVRSC